MAMIASFICCEISSLGTGTRCWSYSHAMGAPAESVTVEIDGRSPLMRSADVPANVSAILLDASPAAPAIGNRDPAVTTPAATHVATSFPSELIADTRTGYVTTPPGPPLRDHPSGTTRRAAIMCRLFTSVV